MNGQAFLGQGERRKMIEAGGRGGDSQISLSFCVLPNMYSILVELKAEIYEQSGRSQPRKNSSDLIASNL